MKVIRTPMLRRTAAAKMPSKAAVKVPDRRAPASGQPDPDGYRPVTADDVDDLTLLPRRFDHFASEVRQSFEILANQILPKLDEIAHKQAVQGDAIAALERRMVLVEKRLFTKRPTRRRKK